MTRASRSMEEPPDTCQLITTPTPQNLPATTDGPTATAQGSSTGFVWVTEDGDPDTVLDTLRQGPGTDLPDSIDLISLTACMRTTETDTTPTTYPMHGTDIRVHQLADENSLTNLGMTIIECVTRLEAAGETPVIVFDGFDSILTTHTPRQLFKFLHVLTGKCRGSNWQLQVRLNGDDTDELTDTFEPLFDTIN